MRLNIDQIGKVRAAIAALASLNNAEIAYMIDTMIEEHDGLADGLADAMSTALLEHATRGDAEPATKREGDAEGWAEA